MFYVGLDLGQARDYTAIVVAEKLPLEGAGPNGHGSEDYELHIRHMERFKDVSYPGIVTRMLGLMETPPLRNNAALAVDATGVGAAVVDMLRRSSLVFDAVTITGGSTETRSDWYSYRVPQRDLVSTLQVLLQQGRLKIAAGLEHAGTLRAELLNFRVKINAVTAHDSYEAWREGDHDDLVFSACLAGWKARKGDHGVFIAFESYS